MQEATRVGRKSHASSVNPNAVRHIKRTWTKTCRSNFRSWSPATLREPTRRSKPERLFLFLFTLTDRTSFSPIPEPETNPTMTTKIKGVQVHPDHADEYESAAQHYAEHDALPKDMPPSGALVYIFADPDAFIDRVAQIRHAQAFAKRETAA